MIYLIALATILLALTLGAWWADANHHETLRDLLGIMAFTVSFFVLLVAL